MRETDGTPESIEIAYYRISITFDAIDNRLFNLDEINK